MATLPLGKIRQKKIIWILLLLILIWAVWSSRDFFVKISSPPPPPSQPKKAEINFGVLKNPLLQGLQPFEEIPTFEFEEGVAVPEEEIGRENPFLPF